MRVRFCGNNEGSDRAYSRIRTEHPDLEVTRERCLKKCGICNCTLFALVDDTPVRGRNVDDLCRQISAAVKPA